MGRLCLSGAERTIHAEGAALANGGHQRQQTWLGGWEQRDLWVGGGSVTSLCFEEGCGARKGLKHCSVDHWPLEH